MRESSRRQEGDVMWKTGVGQAGASLLQGASTIAGSDYFND